MCGITGFTLTDDDANAIDTRALMRTLLLGVESRGRHATGLAWLDTDTGTVRYHKAALDATEFHKQEQNTMPHSSPLAIGHTRFATQGEPSNSWNNHPIRVGPVVGVHNGMIDNDSQIFRDHKDQIGKRDAQVDSEAVFQLISKLAPHNAKIDDPERVKAVIEQLEKIRGSMAIAWLDAQSYRGLNLARGESSPLLVGLTKSGSTFFSSLQSALEVVERQYAVEFEAIVPLKEGEYVIYDGPQLVEWKDWEPPTRWHRVTQRGAMAREDWEDYGAYGYGSYPVARDMRPRTTTSATSASTSKATTTKNVVSRQERDTTTKSGAKKEAKHDAKAAQKAAQTNIRPFETVTIVDHEPVSTIELPRNYTETQISAAADVLRGRGYTEGADGKWRRSTTLSTIMSEGFETGQDVVDRLRRDEAVTKILEPSIDLERSLGPDDLAALRESMSDAEDGYELGTVFADDRNYELANWMILANLTIAPFPMDEDVYRDVYATRERNMVLFYEGPEGKSRGPKEMFHGYARVGDGVLTNIGNESCQGTILAMPTTFPDGAYVILAKRPFKDRKGERWEDEVVFRQWFGFTLVEEPDEIELGPIVVVENETEQTVPLALLAGEPEEATSSAEAS